MVFVESETEVMFDTQAKLIYNQIFDFNRCYTEVSWARRHSDNLSIRFDEDGTGHFYIDDKEVTRQEVDEKCDNRPDYWDIGLRGIPQ